MKKGLIFIALLILVVVGGGIYFLSGAGELIRVQLEKQGTQYLGTNVKVKNVDLALSEGRMSISGFNINNPQGFSPENAFSLQQVTLDLGEITSEPYVVQTVTVNAPEILYEFDESGQGNLIVIKNNLMANLPDSKDTPEPESESQANPKVIVENVTISDVRLKLNFENLPTGDLKIDTKAYEVTLPTFNAGSIGQPDGLPADQVGAAIFNAMLDNVIAQAKSEAKKKIQEEAKKLAKEKLEEQKDKVLDKAKDKLKGLLN